MVHRAAGDAERGGELVQAELLARPELAVDELLLERLVHAVVQVRVWRGVTDMRYVSTARRVRQPAA